MRKLLLLYLLGSTWTVQAAPPGHGLNRLLTVTEWDRACLKLGARETVALCQRMLHRAVANGRSLDPFDPIIPNDRDLLQSRSGVLLRNELNHRLVRVQEDNSLRTTIQLQDDVRCQTYVAAPDLVGAPRSDHRYGPLIESWLHSYTDARGRIRAVRVGRHNGRPALRFDVALDNNRALHGTYALDESANAGIFSTCDYPMASSEAEETARRFFDSIVGSARRYM
jgi:hypothetical protein